MKEQKREWGRKTGDTEHAYKLVGLGASLLRNKENNWHWEQPQMVHFSTPPAMVVIDDFSESGEDRLEIWEIPAKNSIHLLPTCHYSFPPHYSHCHGDYN